MFRSRYEGPADDFNDAIENAFTAVAAQGKTKQYRKFVVEMNQWAVKNIPRGLDERNKQMVTRLSCK